MKLEPGIREYKLPPKHEVAQIVIRGGQNDLMGDVLLTQVARGTLPSLPAIRSLPTVWEHGDQCIKFFPAPNYPYELHVTYLPPEREK